MPVLYDRKGTTLIELMIVIGILGIVLSVIYGIYTYSVKAAESHRLMSELQMETRTAMEYMTRELSQTGFEVGMANCSGAGAGNDDGYPGYATFGDNDSGPRLVMADSSQIAFTFKDLTAKENETDNEVSNSNLKQFRLVHYFINGTTVQRKTYRWDQETPPVWVAQGDAETLVDNVSGLEFVYYNAAGVVVGSNLPYIYTDRCKVRKIKVTLSTLSSRKDPISGSPKTSRLSTDIFLPNMGAATVIDTSPPPAPTNVALSDPHACGTINVTWTGSAVPDLAGYTVEVASSTTTSYTTSASATSASVGRNRLDPITGAWTFAIEDNYAASVRMRAFDSAGNVSAWTSPVSITPQADAPSQPTGLDSTAGTDTVDLTWNANPEADVKGYKVLRRQYGVGSFTEVGISNSTTYTNNVTPPERCTTFEYRIKAVNACNEALVSSESASAYGDAAYSGGITDSPINAITNTTARESLAPSAPTGPGAGGAVLSRAGYRRNFMNWDNPIDADLSYVAIRFNSVLGVPTYPPTVADGTGVEDINVSGIQGRVNKTTLGYATFAPGSVGLALTHTGTTIGTPNLQDNYTYAYSLFAVDTCGNSSVAAFTAQTTVGQCGEETDPSNTSYGAPRWTGDNPLFKLQDNTGCTTNHTLIWNRVDDTYPTGVYDLAGYYVHKLVGTGNFNYGIADTKASGLVLNPAGNPTWSDLSNSGYPTTDDNPTNVGKTFKYYTIPVDCNRETNLSQDPWVPVPAAPTPLPLQSNALTLKPGRVIFNTPTPTPLTNYPLPSDPYTTTGHISFDAFGKPTSDTGFMHNTVMLYFYNTSMGTVTLNGFKIAWDKDAYLSEVRRVDTDACLFGTCLAGGVRSASPVTLSPNIQLNGISENNLSCPSSPCYLKLKLVFTDSAGNVTSTQDMRYNTSGTQLTIDVSSLVYTKSYTSANESSANGTPLSSTPAANTIQCTHTNPQITLSRNDDVTVPFGPTTVASQLNHGGATSPPQTTTGFNIASAYNVDVRTQITDNSGTGLNKKYLYYAVTKQAVATPPSIIAQYTAVAMAPVSGSIYNAVIPKQKDKRVWYFMISQDNQGNWDREPELQNTAQYTAYTYDQDNPCNNTPNPPAGVGLDQNTMTLSWVAPTFNTDGSLINDLAGFNIYQSINNAPFPGTPTATIGAGISSYADTSMSDCKSVRYKIEAIDECATPVKSTAVYSDFAYKGWCYGFDGGIAQGWTTDGIWHVSNRKSSSASYSVYYGCEAAGNPVPGCIAGTFNTGATNSGYLTSPSVTLGASPSVSFDFIKSTECTPYPGNCALYDLLYLQVFDGVSWSAPGVLLPEGASFTNYNYSLLLYAGKTVKIRLYFNSVDGNLNDYEGVYIDNVNFDP